jgi:hypothetical protein
MAEIKSESVADFIPESAADFPRNMQFVFRFNRRRTRHAAFDTLIGIGARTVPAPYYVLIRKAA